MAETVIPIVDSVMCRKITGVGTCTFDELVRRLSTYSWAHVFSAVDQLSRQGRLSVRRLRGVDYVVIDQAGSSHSRVFTRPGVPSGTLTGDPIRRRRVNREMA